MATDKLRIVQIGTGGMGRYHLRLWKEMPGVEVIGLYDAAPAAAEQGAKICDTARVYPNLEAALGDARADAVCIATPNRFHPDMVCAALAAGRHVLCEKPLAATAAEIERMIAVRDRAGTLLMTAQHMRFDTRTATLQRLMAAGRLGDVYYAKAFWLRRRFAPSTPGFVTQAQAVRGPGADIGVHVVDLSMHLLGHPQPVAVSGVSVCKLARTPGRYNAWGRLDPALYDVEDFAAGWVRFANGAVLTVEVSWLLNMLETEAYGVHLFGERGGAQWPELKWVWEEDGIVSTGQVESYDRNVHDGHKNELLAFVEAVRAGGPSPVPAEQSLTVARILDALYASAESGREVRL